MWTWWDEIKDTIDTVGRTWKIVAALQTLFTKLRPPQKESEYIDFLIRKIRQDAYLYRAFQELIGPGDASHHPGIRSNWREIQPNHLVFTRENDDPTREDSKEKKAILWLLSKCIAESARTSGDDQIQQWYFLTDFGWKVKNRYKELYPPD